MNALPLVQSFFSELSKRFQEGGTLFMSLILICLMVALIFLVFGFFYLKKDILKSKKMVTLTSDASLLGLVFGFLGSILGMIQAFDFISANGPVSSEVLAGGLKVSFLTTLFGTITFIIPRIGIMVLKILQKE